MKSNKKLLAVLSVPAITSLLAVAIATPVKAANRDFHDNSVTPSITYANADYTNSDDSLNSLITALTNHPAKMVYEYDGKGYNYQDFLNNYKAAHQPGTKLSDAFKTALSNTPVVPINNLTVASVDTVAAKLVENGTTADKIGLPTTVGVTLSDGTKDTANVAWDTSKFDGTKAGEQTIAGTLSVPAGKAWTLTDAQKAVSVKVIVNVAKTTVASVSAINDVTVQAAGVPSTLKDADLTGKKVSVSDGTNTLTATYVGGSLTTDGKANFILDDSKKLTDAVNYTVTSDWANFTASTFVAKVADPYVKTVTVTTTGIQAGSLNKVCFTAKNQYGESIDLTGKVDKLNVSGTVNGVPLVVAKDGTTEINEATLANGYVTLSKTINENDKVTLKFTNKIGDADVEVGNASFTVVKAADKLVATTISDMKAAYNKDYLANNHKATDAVTEVMPDDVIDLTAAIKDQFANPMDTEKARWVIEDGQDLISVNDKDDTSLPLVSDNTGFEFKANKAGNVTISAYIGNGQKVTYQVTIGAKALSGLTYTSEKTTGLYNQDENIVGNIIANPGATLTPDMLKFDVKATKTSVDVTPADVTVTAKLRGGDVDATKNDIVIVVKSAKPGKFTVTPYVGDSLDKATAKTSFDVTTTVDQTVASIDDIAFNANELKTGKAVTKDVVFRNKHGEVVVLDNANANAAIVTPATVATASISKSDDGTKNTLTLTGKQAGTCQVTINQGTGLKSYTLTFADPTFTKIDAGADITGVVAGDKDEKAKYQTVNFYDQDGVAMTEATSNLVFSVTGPDGKTLDDTSKLITLGSAYSVDKDGTPHFTPIDTSAGGNVAALKVLPVSGLPQGTYTVKVASKDTKISDIFTVTVGADRVAKTVDVTPVSTKVALSGSVDVNIAPKDQYGDFLAVGTKNIAVTPGTNFAASPVSEVINDKGAVTGYKVTLTGLTKGTNDVTVAVNGTDGKALTTNKASMTVDSVASLVNSVAIDTTGINALYPTTNKDGSATVVALNAIAKDVNGSVVPVSSSDLNWSVVSATDKDGNSLAATVDTNGKVTLPSGKTGSAVVKVTTANQKTATITLNFAGDAAAAKAGTTAVVDVDKDGKTLPLDADATKDGIQVALDNDAKDGEKDGAINVKVTAKDQYGNDYTLSQTDDSKIVVLADDTSVVNAKSNNNGTITITAKSVGKADVYVQYNGDTIKLEVSVNQDAQVAADSAKIVNAVSTLAGGNVTATSDVATRTITANISKDESLSDAINIQALKDAGVMPSSLTIGGTTLDLSSASVADIQNAVAAATGKTFAASTLSDLAGKTLTATYNGVQYTVNLVAPIK